MKVAKWPTSNDLIRMLSSFMVFTFNIRFHMFLHFEMVYDVFILYVIKWWYIDIYTSCSYISLSKTNNTACDKMKIVKLFNLLYKYVLTRYPTKGNNTKWQRKQTFSERFDDEEWKKREVAKKLKMIKSFRNEANKQETNKQRKNCRSF